MEDAAFIQIKSISKTYRGADVRSLDQVSLEIKRGEKFGLFGPNGAGKTTLISILCGLLPSSSGEVLFPDPDTGLSRPSFRYRIGYVPQELAFYEVLTPRQNLLYFGALHGLAGDSLKSRVNDLLEHTGLAKEQNKRSGHLSGGTKRRLNMAIGLLRDPELLVLDEPTVGIDVQSKKEIIDFLNELNARGMTMLYSSHHLSEAEQFCDRIALLDRGRVIANGTLPQLLSQHHAGSLEDLFLNLVEHE